MVPQIWLSDLESSWTEHFFCPTGITLKTVHTHSRAFYPQVLADVHSENEKPKDTTVPDDGLAGASDDDDSNQLGTKVEAKFQSKW